MKFLWLVLLAVTMWGGMEIAFKLGRIRGQLDRIERPCSEPLPDGWSR